MKKLHMVRNPYPGLLITFCGLDGCGKTTLINYLVDYFKARGIEPVVTKQPTPAVRQTPIFRTFMDSPDHDQYDYRSLSLMAASDRIQHVHSVIVPALKEGKVVISDRYFYSCLANLKARGYEEDRWIYEISKSIVKPDIPFFVDVPLETAISRVRQRENEKERYINVAFENRLCEEYHMIADEEKAPLLSSDQELEKTCEDMYTVVEKIAKKKGILNAISYKELSPHLYARVLNYLQGFTFEDCENLQLTLKDDLGIDSLTLTTLMIGLEAGFDFVLQDDDLDPVKFKTIGDVVALVFKYAFDPKKERQDCETVGSH